MGREMEILDDIADANALKGNVGTKTQKTGGRTMHQLAKELATMTATLARSEGEIRDSRDAEIAAMIRGAIAAERQEIERQGLIYGGPNYTRAIAGIQGLQKALSYVDPEWYK